MDDKPRKIEPENLNNQWVEKSVAKNGIKKTIVLQLISTWPALIINIIFFVILVIFQINNSNTLSNINNRLNVEVKQQVNTFPESNNSSTNKPIGKNVIAAESNANFNPEDWIIDRLYIDKEGYYCSNVNKQDFEYWSIWSKKSFSPSFDSIKIRLKAKTQNLKEIPPSISLSYGDYQTNYGPQTYYRVVFFDGSFKAIRLFNNKNTSVAQDFLKTEPDFENEITVGISPRVPNPNTRALNINPQLTYTIKTSPDSVPFKPAKDFTTILPTVSSEDNSVQEQIGIGFKQDTCIKILSVEFPG